jgi:N-acetylglucosamine kinase-like BadF-type ATPase
MLVGVDGGGTLTDLVLVDRRATDQLRRRDRR